MPTAEVLELRVLPLIRRTQEVFGAVRSAVRGVWFSREVSITEPEECTDPLSGECEFNPTFFAAIPDDDSGETACRCYANQWQQLVDSPESPSGMVLKNAG